MSASSQIPHAKTPAVVAEYAKSRKFNQLRVGEAWVYLYTMYPLFRCKDLGLKVKSVLESLRKLFPDVAI